MCQFPGKTFTNVDPITLTAQCQIWMIFISIIYTSGSTGQPKGVVHTYRTLSWAASNAIHVLGVSTEDRVMSYLPLAHITERALSPTYQGTTLALNYISLNHSILLRAM